MGTAHILQHCWRLNDDDGDATRPIYLYDLDIESTFSGQHIQLSVQTSLNYDFPVADLPVFVFTLRKRFFFFFFLLPQDYTP